MIEVSDSVLPAARFVRMRRTMFSMSMMASSTTTPTATARPARTIVFTDAPRSVSTTPAATSESGIATRLMNAAFHSYRKAISTSTTSAQPSSSASLRLWIASSMKLAGRKIVSSSSTPCRPGRRSSRASSTPRVTASVFAPWSFSTTSSRPGPSLTTASPMSGCGP